MSETAVDTIERLELRVPRLWAVVIHNDDVTPMEFVVHILTDVFNKDTDEAEAIMLRIHVEGQARVGIYPKEIAFTKVGQVDLQAKNAGFPLATTAEEE